MPRTAIFTICSNNYMPFAHVLLESVHRHHPDADLFVGLADLKIDMPGLYSPDWIVIEAHTLAIPDFPSFAFRYDIMEFNTAIKPFMFLHLLEQREYDAVVYFDPDIEIFAPLDTVLASLYSGTSFFFTPHLCSPNEDSIEPNDLTIMRAGTYNLGFLGVSRTAETLEIISWWARRLRYECIIAQAEGIFVDQKFMDLVPGFASHTFISHDTTMNVAYWNLPQRVLQQAGQGWTVDGAPLSFFHFSGFDPRKPTRLSKHDPRFATDMPEPLRRLTAHYGERLLERGYGKIPSYLYGYSRFASGTAIHHIVRKMFRESHMYWVGDPFDTYEAFLHEPWPEASRTVPNHTVTNFIKFMHDADPKLSGRLDLRQPGHVAELVRWFVNDAGNELHLDLPLVQPAALAVGTLRRPLGTVKPWRAAADKDVTVVGYLRTASEVGEVGRQTMRTLTASGLRVEGLDVGLGMVAARDDASCEALLTEAASAPVQIFNTIGGQLPSVLQHLEPHLRADALRISIPLWELAQFPVTLLDAFCACHEVWAPTRFIQAGLAGRTDRPVIHMPVAFELDPITAVPRHRFGLPEDRYLFFCAFDVLPFMERNSPRAAIRAFCDAFPQRGQACLVLTCLNGDLAPDARSTLLGEIDSNPDIVLLDQTLSREDALGLIAACDAVLSLHRSDGLSRSIAEAMLLDKPVIATGYSASREFVTEQTGYPVDYHLVPVGEGEYPFHSGQLWAEVDVVHAAWIMRRLQHDPRQARPLVVRARELLRDNHSRTHVAALQTRRLRELGMQWA